MFEITIAIRETGSNRITVECKADALDATVFEVLNGHKLYELLKATVSKNKVGKYAEIVSDDPESFEEEIKRTRTLFEG